MEIDQSVNPQALLKTASARYAAQQVACYDLMWRQLRSKIVDARVDGETLMVFDHIFELGRAVGRAEAWGESLQGTHP